MIKSKHRKKLVFFNRLLLLVCWLVLLGGLLIACIFNRLWMFLVALGLPPLRYWLCPVFPKAKEDMLDDRVNRIVPFSTAVIFLTRPSKIRAMRWIYRLTGIFLLIVLMIYNGYLMLGLDTLYLNYGTNDQVKYLGLDDDIEAFGKKYSLLSSQLEMLQKLRDSNTKYSNQQFQEDVNYIINLNQAVALNVLGINLKLNVLDQNNATVLTEKDELQLKELQKKQKSLK